MRVRRGRSDTRPRPDPRKAVAETTPDRPPCGAAPPRRSPIPPFLAAYYLFCLAAVIVAWLKGGHPERLGAMALLVVFGLSAFPSPMRIWNVAVDDAAGDLVLALVFGWMALSRERWWPLAMTAVMTLTLLVHAAMFIAPTLGAYAEVSARIGLGIAVGLTLLVGSGERWLAGERAVSSTAVWRRRRATS